MNNKRILILDDDADIRYTIAAICQTQGWQAIEAADYAQARQVLATMTPEVILVDYHMPQMDGICAVREIRKDNKQSSILVLTIEESDSVVQRFFDAGADDYALKPVKAPDLIARVRMHLRLNEQKRFYTDVKKGINPKTLRLLITYLETAHEDVSIEEMEAALPINQKTLYRYLQYLQESRQVVVTNQYGKVGRPKVYYTLKDKKT